MNSTVRGVQARRFAAASKTAATAVRVNSATQKRPTQEIHRVRLNNLLDLIEKRFEKKSARLAKAIGKSHTYLWQLIHGHRAMGETTARYIEQQLGLGVGELDRTTGAFERTTLLTQHLGDGQTRNYRMVPQVSLAEFTAQPSTKAEQLRPCPIGLADGPAHMRCSEETVYFKAEISMGARIQRGEMIFADKKVKILEDGALYVVKPKSGPCRRVCVVREAQRSENGYVFASLSDKREPLEEHEVKVEARIFYAAREV